MMERFMRIGGKLDLILSLLCEKDTEGALIEKGTEKDISGSGMNRACDKRVGEELTSGA